jgi:high affinity sulfate transporter 1
MTRKESLLLAQAHKGSTLSSIFPIVDQLKSYTISSWLADLKAGITISLVLLPTAIAYSSLAGVDPIRSLISAVFPLFIYALLGASRHLSVGPEAVTSVLTGAAVMQEVQEHGGNPNEIASFLALSVGIFAVFLCFIQAGFIDNIISGFLLTGFVTGAALLIMTEQLPELLGLGNISKEREASTFSKIANLAKATTSVHLPSLLIGLSCLIFLLILKHFKKKAKSSYIKSIPDVLLIVVLSTLLSFALSFKERGIRILSDFSTAVVPPQAPKFDFQQLQRLIPVIITITLSGFIESQAVTKQTSVIAFPSGDRELFALGMANVVGSLFGAHVTFGSLPRSRILANAGGQTNLAGVIAGSFVFILFTAASRILVFLPRCTLAAIVFNAAIDLIEWHEIYFLFHMKSLREIFFFFSTLAMTFFVPIGFGILFCLALACFVILKRSTLLRLSMMGYVPSYDHDAYVDFSDYPNAQLVDNIIILSLKGPLEFYTAGRLRRQIEMLWEVEQDHLRRHSGPIHIPEVNSTYGELFVHSQTHPFVIILEFSACSSIDSAGMYILHEMVCGFECVGTKTIFSGIKEKHNKLFQDSGIMNLLGKQIVPKIQDAVSLAKLMSEKSVA